MEAIAWLLLAGVVAIVLALAVFLQRSKGVKSDEGEGAGEDGVREEAVPERRAQPRNVRARVAALRRARGETDTHTEQAGEEEAGHVEDIVEEMLEKEERKVGGKIGTKKLKRIQEKAERKAMREQEEALREDRKHREALREEERQKELEEERLRLQKEEEEEKKRKEEEAAREQEEYLRLKEGFTVEEEGVDSKDDETQARGVQDFIDYIKKMKVVYMEDLAAEFDLKTQDAISRVQSLQESGELSGVVDDRGKFIFISDLELQAVANFIKQRGRVSIAELVSSSNRLINLQPETSAITS